jgi:TolA-binding protein
MTIVGLHPEELFDKLLAGELTASERERLHQHLAACDVCRFEYAARGDFQAEALSLSAAEPPPLLPLRTPVPVAPAAPQRRRRSRLMVWGLAAAALITASGAVASGIVGKAPWHVVSLVFSQATPRASQPAPTAQVQAGSGCQGADCAAASAPAEQASVGGEKSGEKSSVVSRQSSGRREKSGEKSSVVSRQWSGRGETSSVVSRQSSVVSSDPAVNEPVANEPSSSAKLFAEANQARRSGDVGRASGLYHLLQEQFPGSAEAELSRVTLSLLLLDSGDARGALSGFERYLAGSSRGLEAEALVGRARALGRLGRRDLEASAWQEVQRKYPRSIYGRQATERLSALGQP